MRKGGDDVLLPPPLPLFAGGGKREKPTPASLTLPRQPAHDLVELIEIAVADVHGTAGVAMIDVDREPKGIAKPLLERDRIGVFHGAAARLLGFAYGYALDMRQRLGLTHIEALLDNAFGDAHRIRHADQRPGMARG